MSSIKKNLLANFGGKCIQALLSFVFTPLYVSLIGVESWGLVGFYTTLSVLLSFLDMGLGTTINREMARLSIQENSAREIRRTTRTIEIIYWGVAGIIALLMPMFSSFIAHSWVHVGALSEETIQQAICFMGFAFAIQWPANLYGCGLMGLQRQVLVNGLVTSISIFRTLGLLISLIYISPTVQMFFFWHICVNIFQTILVGIILWKSLPKDTEPARFDMEILRRLWRFTMGISGITILSIILTQLDKVILSKMLPLEKFGLYSLACTVAAGLYFISGPIFSSFFPRFAELISQGDTTKLKKIYHESSQIMTALIAPVALMVILFSKEMLSLWMRNSSLVQEIHLFASLLMVGTLLNGLVTLPHALQIAYGWTKLAIYKNLIAICFSIPLLFWGVNTFGAIVACYVWILLNFCYLVIEIPLMHRRVLQGEKWSWYLFDLALPILGALTVLLPVRFLLPQNLGWFPMALILLMTFALATLASAVLAPDLRKKIVSYSFRKTIV